MEALFLSFEYLAGLVVDIMVLFFVAGWLKIRGNSFVKAIVLVLVSAVLGYIIGPLLLATFFLSISAFLIALVASLIIRLVLIKAVYRIRSLKAISLWIVSAIASVVVSFFIPF